MTDTGDRPRVLTQTDGDVWRITLDRPEAGNAIDPAMAAGLAEALRNRPETTRAVLLLAKGPRFCVGGDVQRFVLAGVQGAVAGAAVGLVGACDLVVAGRSTTITPAYGALGLSPDGGSSWALARALGTPRALELMLTNGSLTAADAHLFGLVGRLVEDDELQSAAIALAHQVAAGPVRAMVRTRDLVRRAATRSLDDQLDEEARLIAESAADPEGREGILAFVGKRPPNFRDAR
jgi:2-(1,2-epoxy-1,2-dihydrophenyl)acetyl-CoA isomerase